MVEKRGSPKPCLTGACLKPPQSPNLDYTPKRPAGIDELAQKRAHSRDLHTIVISLDPAGPATRIDVVLPADRAVIPSSLCLTRETFRPSGLRCPPPELPRFCHSIPKSQAPPSRILACQVQLATVFLAASSLSHRRRLDHLPRNIYNQYTKRFHNQQRPSSGKLTANISNGGYATPEREFNHRRLTKTPEMSRSIFEGPQRRLVELLVLASAATAATISVGSTSLSLSNFQLITELSVPLGCLLSYNNPIEGCEATDFGSTGTCSQKCRNGLTRMQSNLQDVCQSVQVQVNTILGQALSGNLVNLLCGALNQQTSSAVQTISTTTIIILPSTTAIAPPPPPPPPATTSVAPPPPPTTSLSTSTPIILPPSSQAPLPPATTAIPPVSSQAPPIIPPTTIVTSTTTTESQASPQSTSSAPVNPLDALLMNGGMASRPRGDITWGLPVLAVVVYGII
ncbi:hypothetical protein Landi51_07765 [Colletotrichum acutatum]